MSRIPIMDARYPDSLPKTEEVETRLRAFLQAIREKADPDPDPSDDADARFLSPSAITCDERMRIHRRARAICDRVEAATGLSHLTTEARARLPVLRDGAALIEAPTEHRADEIAGALHADMPWMGPATERVWQAMRASVRNGDAGLRLPPMLLVGSARIGKSHWARRLGVLAGLPATVIDATGEPAGFAVVGSQKGWSSASPGRVMETILARGVANPLIVIDEFEKAGNARSTDRTSHGLANVSLPLLERSTAEIWSRPYFRVRFDVSWVSWILTANILDGLSAPLLSRCPPLHLPDLRNEQLLAFAARKATEARLPDEAVSAILSMLGEGTGDRRPSPRTAIRMVDRAGAIGGMPTLH